jgi:DNA-binding transcriptional MerR regulator
MKGGTDINKSFKIVETPSINTPILVYNTLEGIQQLESGITAAAKGVADEDKVGIYEGNQANVADRYGVWNKSYTQGYKRFAVLYKNGIEDNLSMKVAVKILGSKGLEETVFVSRRDLKPQAEWSIMIESSNAEEQADAADKRNKLTFMSQYRNDPLINQKMLFEQGAELVGFSNDEIRQFLDASEYGEADLIAEAERDMEDLLNKKIIEPNERANTVYANHILDYMKDHKEDMDEDTFLLFTDYLSRVEPIIMRNMGTQLQNTLAKEGASPGALGPVQPEVQGQTEGQLKSSKKTRTRVKALLKNQGSR